MRAFELHLLGLCVTLTMLPAAHPRAFGLSGQLQARSTPATPDDALMAARHAIDHADWKTAERELRQQAGLTPGAAEPHFLLGYVLFREQRATASLAEYTAGAGLRTPTADELVVVASDYVLLKSFGDAERWLLYATRLSPENATAWYLLGRTQYNLDHAADAVASFQQRLRLSPNDVRAEYNLGLALEKLDRSAEAERAYQAAIDWQKDATARDPQPYLDLGMMLLAEHQEDRALPSLREAVVIAPRNALAHQELGLAYEALGRNSEAAAAFLRATELAPNAEQPHFFLGRVYRRLGRGADASVQFAEAKRLAGVSSAKDTPNDVQPLGPE